MMGTPANEHPDNFHNANFDEAVGRLVALIRRHRPQVLITYNEDGGYGHPDHLQSHKVTAAAYDAAGDPARYPEAGDPGHRASSTRSPGRARTGGGCATS
ncbi:MAG: PIG-L family deacetylase [Thermomicrobiales bacterium]